MRVQAEKHWVSGEGDGEINALTPVSSFSPVSHCLPLAGLTENLRQGTRVLVIEHLLGHPAGQKRIERDTEYSLGSVLVEGRVGGCGKEAVPKFLPHFN